MQLQESGQMYLETILILSQRSTSVHAVDISDHMGYSKPSVSRAVGLLRKGGYVTVEEDGRIFLTEDGRAEAQRIYDRHRLITQLLVTLGVDEQIASEDACRMEHDISDATFEAIRTYLEGK
ncbi:MAG: metal-dependent transcriptional regulator [Clostridia bacterium]|nr:metal-dependent transcriptional regulator [Clostridia bacterium]